MPDQPPTSPHDLNARLARMEARLEAMQDFYERERVEAKEDRRRLYAKLDEQDRKIDRLTSRLDQNTGRMAVLGTLFIGLPAAAATWLITHLLGGPGQ